MDGDVKPITTADGAVELARADISRPIASRPKTLRWMIVVGLLLILNAFVLAVLIVLHARARLRRQGIESPLPTQPAAAARGPSTCRR